MDYFNEQVPPPTAKAVHHVLADALETLTPELYSVVVPFTVQAHL
jgi:hypothetical protein